MSTTPDLSARFLALHRGDGPLLLANPWDAGSARLLAWLGFAALATTSSGFAASLGLFDGSVGLLETIAHAAVIAAAAGLPVTADLENGFADDPAGVAATVALAAAAGLAGCSIEDATGRAQAPIYHPRLAAERIAAAAQTAHSGPRRLVLTARAENHLHGRPDLADTIDRLRSFEEAGADVLYAPGVTAPGDIAAIVAAVERPVNVLLLPDGPGVSELTDLGVRRISVGGAFAYAALGALAEAGRGLLQEGSTAFFAQTAAGRLAAQASFGA